MSDRRLDIILVEDDASMRDAMRRMLQASGCRVTSFESAEALSEAGADKATKCDCLVFDIGLPGMSGLDLCRTLRADALSPPCILITGIDTPGLLDLARCAGGHVCLFKPFTGTALLNAIKHAVLR